MITNEEIDAFIRLVDQVPIQTPVSIDQSYIADTFGIKTEHLIGEQAIRDSLFKLIRDEIVTQNIANSLNLRSLKNALVRRFIFQEGFYAYHEVPNWILFGVNEPAFRPLSEQDRWIKAISATYALKAISSYGPSEIGGERNIIVADAAKRLQSKSYQLGIDGSRFFFEDGELERCCSELEQLMKKIGGAFVVSTLLRLLQQQARFNHGRYLVGRHAQTFPLNNSGPSIPLGYLLNLSMRHMDRRTYRFQGPVLFGQLISLAGDIVAVMDVETYNAFEFMFTDHANLSKYLQGIMLGDFCLSFRQIVAKDAVEMISGLFNWVDSSYMKKELGWTISDAINLAKAALTATHPKNVNLILQRDDLIKASGCSLATLQCMLPHFTHKTTELNAGFLTPDDAEAANFDLKPFIWQPGNKLLLMSPPLCSIGFFEALATATRSLSRYAKNADMYIGQEIEPMLARAFHDRGIVPSVVSEKYKIGKKIYDCDLVVESTHAVILFEIKKKSLTKSAMSGQTLEGIIDLCRSMIKAQTQLGLQEIKLRKAGKILFENGSLIELNNRNIERIAVTLIDWGSVQGRMVSDNVLKILASSNIGATTDISQEQVKVLSEINDLIVVLQEQMKGLEELKGVSRQPFFDCLFLGIPQIIFFSKWNEKCG